MKLRIRSVAITLALSFATAASTADDAKKPNRIERAADKTGQAIERGAKKTGRALEHAAKKTGAALDHAANKTEAWVRKKTE